jgi:ubiquinone/menaquinone biosynthesis C-methylase UbiE
VNFDKVAPHYRWLERVAFGRALEECRAALLPQIAGCERALCIGDGDGRFTELLLKAQPCMRVDVVERSRSMIRLARQRSSATFFHANALAFTPDDRYDLVVTHFVLDTFTDAQVSTLVPLVRKSAAGGFWLISEFQACGPASRFLIWLMYRFFRITAGLRVESIPDYRAAFISSGFTLQKSWTKWNGFLISELWRIPDVTPPTTNGTPTQPARPV